MRMASRKTDRLPQQSHPYTPTPDGFERRLRAWVRLPMDDVPIPDVGGASASPEEHDVRHHTGQITPERKGYRRRRGGGPDAREGRAARP
jgi:hypothetical protein